MASTTLAGKPIIIVAVGMMVGGLVYFIIGFDKVIFKEFYDNLKKRNVEEKDHHPF